MGKQGKNTAKKKAARQEAKAAEKTDRELQKNLPAKLDAVLAKGQEEAKKIDLFADAPPKEMCLICLHPHICEGVNGMSSFVVHSCCGKTICPGCMHASDVYVDKVNARKKKNKEPLLQYTCAFCREPRIITDRESELRRYEKRAAVNDYHSIIALATMHALGDGTPKNETKALDLLCLAAELGAVEAYSAIGKAYGKGHVVGKNEIRAIAFFEVAAKKGHLDARHTLGFLEKDHSPAIRHYKIAAEAGYQESLDTLKRYLRGEENKGLVDEDEFEEILNKCLASKAEMKTDQRDALDALAKQQEKIVE